VLQVVEWGRSARGGSPTPNLSRAPSPRSPSSVRPACARPCARESCRLEGIDHPAAFPITPRISRTVTARRRQHPYVITHVALQATDCNR